MPAVLLDLYDTLAWANWPAVQQGRAALARRAGVPVEALDGRWETSHEARMRGTFGSLEGDLAHVLGIGGRTFTMPAVLAELAALEYRNWAENVHLYPDVEPVLASLRQRGYRLGLVSNASREAAAVIPVLGLDRLVDAVVVSCEVGSVKPEPTLLRRALDQLGTRAEDSVLVDDALTNVLAARALGMRGVHLAREGCALSHASPCHVSLGAWLATA